MLWCILHRCYIFDPILQELAWRQQLAAALAFRHASLWATNQLVSDVVLPCLIKLLKVVSCLWFELYGAACDAFDCRTGPRVCGSRLVFPDAFSPTPTP